MALEAHIARRTRGDAAAADLGTRQLQMPRIELVVEGDRRIGDADAADVELRRLAWLCGALVLRLRGPEQVVDVGLAILRALERRAQPIDLHAIDDHLRSEERRVGKECSLTCR